MEIKNQTGEAWRDLYLQDGKGVITEGNLLSYSSIDNR